MWFIWAKWMSHKLTFLFAFYTRAIFFGVPQQKFQSPTQAKIFLFNYSILFWPFRTIFFLFCVNQRLRNRWPTLEELFSRVPNFWSYSYFWDPSSTHRVLFDLSKKQYFKNFQFSLFKIFLTFLDVHFSFAAGLSKVVVVVSVDNKNLFYPTCWGEEDTIGHLLLVFPFHSLLPCVSWFSKSVIWLSLSFFLRTSRYTFARSSSPS